MGKDILNFLGCSSVLLLTTAETRVDTPGLYYNFGEILYLASARLSLSVSGSVVNLFPVLLLFLAIYRTNLLV